MKKILNVILNILLIIWQLPQEIIGGLMYIMLPNFATQKVKGAIVCFTPWMQGGVTLGNFVFINEIYYKDGYKSSRKKIIKHEWGHTVQSKILGPFYLAWFGIGIPSLIHAAIHQKGDYYHFWTEKWANKLSEKYFKLW